MSATPGFDEFCDLIKSHLGEGCPDFTFDTPIMAICKSVPTLFFLVTNLELRNPHFRLPEQADLEHITVSDVHHYLTTMGPDHEEVNAQ